MTTLFTDNFNRANGALGANWTDVDAGFAIVSNTAEITGGLSSAKNNSATYPADQWAQIKLGSVISPNADEGAGVILRVTGSDLYFVHVSSVDSHLYKRIGGVYTDISGTPGPGGAAGDVIYAEVQGTTLLVKKNGSTIIGPITDSALSSGAAGIWADGAGAVNLDDFSAGDFAGGTPDQIWQETGDWYEGTTLAEIEGLDPGPWGWYSDDLVTGRANAEQPPAPELPVSYEWEDVNLAEANLYQWPWGQGPPPADDDTAVYRFEDQHLYIEVPDEDFGFSADPLSADLVAAVDFPYIEDGSNQQPEVIDEDFAFSLAPLPDDNDVAASRAFDSDEQPEYPEEDFAFADAPLSADVVVATDPMPVELGNDWEELEQLEGFSVDPLPDDIFDQLFYVFGGFDDPIDDDTEVGFFDWQIDSEVVDSVPFVELGQPDDPEDQEGFADAPLADDNEVAAARVFDSDEQPEDVDEDFGFSIDGQPDVVDDLTGSEFSTDPEPEETQEGFADQPLADDVLDQIVCEDGSAQLEDVDEDFGTQSVDPLPDDVQSDQVFTNTADWWPDDVVEEPEGFTDAPLSADQVFEEPLPFCDFPSQAEEPEDEAFGFDFNVTPDDFIPPAFFIHGNDDGEKKRKKPKNERAEIRRAILEAFGDAPERAKEQAKPLVEALTPQIDIEELKQTLEALRTFIRLAKEEDDDDDFLLML